MALDPLNSVSATELYKLVIYPATIYKPVSPSVTPVFTTYGEERRVFIFALYWIMCLFSIVVPNKSSPVSLSLCCLDVQYCFPTLACHKTKKRSNALQYFKDAC